MSKRELIDRIRLLNPTAPGPFLAKFPEADLSQYLAHLQEASARERARAEHQAAEEAEPLAMAV